MIAPIVGCLLSLAVIVAVWLDWRRSYKPPKPGEVWEFHDGSPWPTDFAVTVIDVKAGWVKYRYSEMCNDRTERLSNFMALFRRQSQP